MLSIQAHSESWTIRGSFNISRGSKTKAEVVVAQIFEGGKLLGRGEGVPYPRYGESTLKCIKAIDDISKALSEEPSRQKLLEMMHAGAARNALDCALWDYESKKKGKPVWQLAGLEPPDTCETAYTIGVDQPEAMSQAVRNLQEWTLFKLKLKDADDLQRVEAVRHAAPNARIIVDANEAWDELQLSEFSPKLRQLGVELIE